MSQTSVVDVIVSVLVLAIVYVLVRPQSKGAETVANLGSALQAIVRSAADLA